MHRFYLPPAECRGSEVTLTGPEAHHGLRVLRLHCGEQVSVLDGAGHEHRAQVVNLSRQTVHLKILETLAEPAPSCRITLIQAIPKGKLFDTILQKATELGAHRIIPLLSARVVTQPDEARSEHKHEHWRQVAIEAIKQCGSRWLPQVDPPTPLPPVLAQNNQFDLPLLASLQPGSRHPRQYFNAFRQQRQAAPRSICVWIGPEGDFTPEEVAAVQNAGALPITLGQRVLRTDTATAYCLSVLNYELQAPAD